MLNWNSRSRSQAHCTNPDACNARNNFFAEHSDALQYSDDGAWVMGGDDYDGTRCAFRLVLCRVKSLLVFSMWRADLQMTPWASCNF